MTAPLLRKSVKAAFAFDCIHCIRALFSWKHIAELAFSNNSRLIEREIPKNLNRINKKNIAVIEICL